MSDHIELFQILDDPDILLPVEVPLLEALVRWSGFGELPGTTLFLVAAPDDDTEPAEGVEPQ